MFKKMKIILSKKQLGSFYFFILLSFISMILETLGIGLIIPFMQALVTDGINQHLTNFLNFLSIGFEKIPVCGSNNEVLSHHKLNIKCIERQSILIN